MLSDIEVDTEQIPPKHAANQKALSLSHIGPHRDMQAIHSVAPGPNPLKLAQTPSISLLTYIYLSLRAAFFPK
jgi:hypothetical protein